MLLKKQNELSKVGKRQKFNNKKNGKIHDKIVAIWVCGKFNNEKNKKK